MHSGWPTIRPGPSRKWSVKIKMRVWETRYVMHVGTGGVLLNFSGVLRVSRTAGSGGQMAEAAPTV
jgi:hypothetical protein